MNPNVPPQPGQAPTQSGISPQLAQLMQRGNLQQTPNPTQAPQDPSTQAPMQPQPAAPTPDAAAQPPMAPGVSSATAPTPQQPFDPAEIKTIEGALTSRLKLLSKIQGATAGIQ